MNACIRRHRVLAAAVVVVAMFVSAGDTHAAQKEAPAVRKAAGGFDAVEAVKGCGKFAFVKRHHFNRPFGVGTIYCWQIYRPG